MPGDIVVVTPAESKPLTGQIRQYTWSDIVAIIKTHQRELVIANIVALLGALAAVPIPLFIPLLVDELVLNRPGSILPLLKTILPSILHQPIGYVCAIFAITILLRLATLVFNTWQYKKFTLIAKDVIFQMRHSMLGVVQKISMAEYENLGSGSVASHLVTDLNTIDDFLGASISRFIVAVLSIIGTAIVLFWMHWQLAILVLFFNPLVIYFTMVMGKKVKEFKRAENDAFEVFQQGLIEVLEGIHQIRAANSEQHYMKRLVSQAQIVRENAVEYEWRSNAAARASFIIFQLGVDFFRAVAILVVIMSDLTIGQMFAIFGYLWFMMAPVQEILGIQYSYYAANGALARVNKLLARKTEPEYPHNNNPFADKETVGITIEALHFTYGDGDEVLKGIDLSIQSGAKVAIVGASGGGKSTLVQAILGMYQPSSGRVLFDGVPQTEIGLDVIRTNVATVLQYPTLFNDTVRANLSMGKDFTDESLWQALHLSQLESTVKALDKGLDARLGRNGVRFSGGQRQRLAIARMVLSNPKVVILDEATSALDAETEFQLHQQLQKFLAGRTTIIIAHRLSAVKQADHVYVFEDGKVCEEGSHEALISQQGLYAKLYGYRQ